MVTLKGEDLLILKELFLYLFYLPQWRPSAGLHRYKGNPIIWNSGGISPLMF